MEKALINKIINFSNVDGPGNRMAIFFQSCPFSCLYCHNPETINLCKNCGKCIEFCPKKAISLDDNNKIVWNETKCINCDTCIKICPNLSSPKTRYYTIDELFEKIKQIKPFIRGITVSGGECTNWSKFLLELFPKVKKLGLTCLIDSNGCTDFKEIEELINIFDGVMLDVKAYDNKFHNFITGKDNKIVLKNLNFLIQNQKLEEVRTVILPNFDEENYKTVSAVAKIIPANIRYKLLKYRHFGVRKQGIDTFGQVIVQDNKLKELKKVAENLGLKNVVII